MPRVPIEENEVRVDRDAHAGDGRRPRDRSSSMPSDIAARKSAGFCGFTINFTSSRGPSWNTRFATFDMVLATMDRSSTGIPSLSIKGISSLSKVE